MARGPAPKRDGQRRRANEPAGGMAETVVMAGAVERPEADSSWHPVMVRWFESLGDSGQSVFYEPSDWAFAWVTAEALSKDLHAGDSIPGSVMSAFHKACSLLLVTEGDRRRARLEIERGAVDSGELPENVSKLDEYKAKLSG